MHDLQIPHGGTGPMLVDPKKTAKVGHPRFYALLELMEEIHRRKNMSYAAEHEPLMNLRRSRKLGVLPSTGAMVRMTDKWCRIEEFVAGNKPDITGEGLADALIDNAVYSLISLVLLEEEKNIEYRLADDCRLRPEPWAEQSL